MEIGFRFRAGQKPPDVLAVGYQQEYRHRTAEQDKGKIVLAEYENGIDGQQDAGGHRGQGDVPAEHEDDGEGGQT